MMTVIIHVLLVTVLLPNINGIPAAAEMKAGTDVASKGLGAEVSSTTENTHALRHKARKNRKMANSADNIAEETSPTSAQDKPATPSTTAASTHAGEKDKDQSPSEGAELDHLTEAVLAGFGESAGLPSVQHDVTDELKKPPSQHDYFKPKNPAASETPSSFGEEIVEPDTPVVHALAEAFAGYHGQNEVRAHAVAIADKPGQKADALAIAYGFQNVNTTPIIPVANTPISNSEKLIDDLLEVLDMESSPKFRFAIPETENKDYFQEYQNYYYGFNRPNYIKSLPSNFRDYNPPYESLKEDEESLHNLYTKELPYQNSYSRIRGHSVVRPQWPRQPPPKFRVYNPPYQNLEEDKESLHNLYSKELPYQNSYSRIRGRSVVRPQWPRQPPPKYRVYNPPYQNLEEDKESLHNLYSKGPPYQHSYSKIRWPSVVRPQWIYRQGEYEEFDPNDDVKDTIQQDEWPYNQDYIVFE